jgi:hypothetical protein
MNILLDVGAAGIFSKVMFAIQNLVKYNPENAYVNCLDENANIIYTNPFDYVFEQPKVDRTYERYFAQGLGSYTYRNKIEESALFYSYKNCAEKFVFTKDLREFIHSNRNLVSHNTIGIHVRLTDMNVLHKIYGVYNIDHYLQLAESLLLKTDANIFVASDNDESLCRFRGEFGERVGYVPNMLRCKQDDGNSTQLQYDLMYKKRFWLEAFLEMYLLSKCDTIVCRTSNLSNVAKIFSKKKQKCIWLPQLQSWDWKEKRRPR